MITPLTDVAEPMDYEEMKAGLDAWRQRDRLQRSPITCRFFCPSAEDVEAGEAELHPQWPFDRALKNPSCHNLAIVRPHVVGDCEMTEMDQNNCPAYEATDVAVAAAAESPTGTTWRLCHPWVANAMRVWRIYEDDEPRFTSVEEAEARQHFEESTKGFTVLDVEVDSAIEVLVG